MAQKTVGYVELEWVCPNCGSRNPGPAQKCGTCGAGQPTDVEFVQPVQEELITDAEVAAEVQAGPDVHCPYCGVRNRATAQTCRNCGAPLQGATARQAGRILGAYRDQPLVDEVACPNCGAMNPPQARRCRKCGAGLVPGPELERRAQAARSRTKTGRGFRRALLLGLLGFVAVAVLFMVLSTRTSDAVGVVKDVSWRRTIVVEGLAPVQKANWLDEIPADAELGQCRSKVARVQDEPASNAVEVCGTPYTVDTGTGYGQVVQDCQYQILAEWCEYTVEEWQAVDSVVASGEGTAAAWPTLGLAANQRAGERQEEYIITFETDGKTYKYVVRDPAQAAAFDEGSRWTLSINTFGALTGVEPAR